MEQGQLTLALGRHVQLHPARGEQVTVQPRGGYVAGDATAESDQPQYVAARFDDEQQLHYHPR